MSNTVSPEEWARRARKMQTAIDDAGMGPPAVFTLDEAGVERLAAAIQATILTSIDHYMRPEEGGAYRKFWTDLTEAEKRHVRQDAAAIVEALRGEP